MIENFFVNFLVLFALVNAAEKGHYVGCYKKLNNHEQEKDLSVVKDCLNFCGDQFYR